MKTKILVTLAALAVTLLLPHGAWATSCTQGVFSGGPTIQLTITNATGVNVDVQVSCSIVSGNTQLAVGFVSSNLGSAAVGIDKFFYDGTTAVPTFANVDKTWGATATVEADGFGTFDAGVQGGGNGTGLGTSTSNASCPNCAILFTFTGSNITFTGFAVHVRFADCSGWVSDLSPKTGNTDQFTGCTVVPEPGTMALFGGGLVAIAGIIRRRLASV